LGGCVDFAGRAGAAALGVGDAADCVNERELANAKIRTKKAHLHPRDIRAFLQILFRGPKWGRR
jgi:hypothetical protein